MFGEIGIEKLLLIFGIVLVLFGGKRMPELGAALGKGIREFKRGVTGILDVPNRYAELDERSDVAEPREVREAPARDDGNEEGPRRLIS